ncbi:hypothetical protein HJC23_008775 [Cyclotella cryptica]|uniref:Uncharacterized protein n=1 Tax=Cyclotella cryptica TaxID=29204 RepID=A0ABD3PDK1_9STRA
MSPLLVESQPAGLSTAESDSSCSFSVASNAAAMRSNNHHHSIAIHASPLGGEVKSAVDSSVDTKPQISTTVAASTRRSSMKRIVSMPKITTRSPKTHIDTAARRHAVDPCSLSLSSSIGSSAPAVLIRAPSVDSIESKPIRSIMTSRTLHESLHRGRTQRKQRTGSITFGQVSIREYERILGDNPSVTSGPPLSIGWRYAPQPIQIDVDTFEAGKGLPRSSSEYLVPKAVREKILREHAEASRRELAHAVRNINRQKQQRRKTVVNLPLAPAEERIEKVKRSVQKVLKARAPYSKEEARLWDEAHAVAMEKARRLEESIRNGEKLSMKKVYEIGTPWNNVVPSRSNSKREEIDDGCSEEAKRSESFHEDDTGAENDLKDSVETSTSAQVPPDISNACKYEPQPQKRRVSIDTSNLESSSPDRNIRASRFEDNFRHSDSDIAGLTKLKSEIVASENENDVDEIFAKLVLDEGAVN